MPLWSRACPNDPLRVVRRNPLGRILFGVGVCGPSANEQEFAYQSSVTVSGYYEDDTESVELPYTPVDYGSNFFVSVSGQAVPVPPTQAYASEYAYGSTITQSGSYSYVYEPGGPVVYPPTQVQSQMQDSGGHALIDVSGFIFEPQHDATVQDQTSVYSIEPSGISLLSGDALGEDAGTPANLEVNGTYLVAGMSSLEDSAAPSNVSVSGLHVVYLTFADGRDSASSTFIEVAGRFLQSGDPSGIDTAGHFVDTSGQYSDGSQESILPQELEDADKPFNRIDISGVYQFGSPILDEAGDYILDEAGEPVMDET